MSSYLAKIVEKGKNFDVVSLPFKKFAPILKDSNGTEITCSSVSAGWREINYRYEGVTIPNIGSDCTVYLDYDNDTGEVRVEIENNEVVE